MDVPSRPSVPTRPPGREVTIEPHRVLRPDHANGEFERALLDHLYACGWTGAPRQHGLDPRGRLVYDYVPGTAVHHDRPLPDRYLVRAARLAREFHDLTAGTDLAGGEEVVCHNDLAPKNTIDRAGVPVAFVDWELAAPGARLHDVAHLCWQFVRLGPGCADAPRRVRLVCDAYGLDDRSRVVGTVLWWQDRCRRGIEAGAEAGDPRMRALRDAGAAVDVSRAHTWTTAHRKALEDALADGCPPAASRA